jgi:hypothetical protein
MDEVPRSSYRRATNVRYAMNARSLGFAMVAFGASVCVACSSSNAPAGADGGSGSSASSSSSSGVSDSGSAGSDASADAGQSLVGAWRFFDSGNGASLVIQFNSDGTYEQDNSQSTSTGTIDERQTGTFAVSGSNVTFTVLHWSCPGAVPAPSTSSFSFENGDLLLVIPQATLDFVPYVPDAGGSSGTEGGVQVTLGCYPDDSGPFFASPLH